MIREVVTYGRQMASDWTAANVHLDWRTVRTSNGGLLQDRIRGIGKCYGAALPIQRRERGQLDQRPSRARRRSASAHVLYDAAAIGVIGWLVIGSWWNPVSWWDDVSGLTVQAWNDVKAWVHRAINDVQTLISGAFDLIDFVFTVITNALQAGLNIVGNIATGAFDWVLHAADTVTGWIQTGLYWLWDNVITPGFQWIEGALNWAVGILQDAINLVSAGVDWLVANIIDPIFSWIAHAAETVGGWIWDAVQGFYNDVIAPIFAGIEWWVNLLANLWQWIVTVVVDVINVCEKAMGWLLWFADHSFDDLVQLLTGRGPVDTRDWILGELQSSDAFVRGFIDALERVLD